MQKMMDKLEFTQRPETVAVHVTCSSTKLSLTEKFKVVAEACARKVVMPAKVRCCGFAGDKGFEVPELNESALAELKDSLRSIGFHLKTMIFAYLLGLWA